MATAAKRVLRSLDDDLLGGRVRSLYRRRLKFARSNLPRLSASTPFPDPGTADAQGIVALGGGLAPERLLEAYRRGLFPLFQPGEPVQWWSPDPRCIIEPASLHVSRRLREHLRKDLFTVTFDRDFAAIITACRDLRHGDTWITDEVVASYTALRDRGCVHSVEVWAGKTLAGGLYGVSLGGFFGIESMCSMEDNASKAALVVLATKLREHGFLVIDCQFPKEHFLRFGARAISRREFAALLERALGLEEADRLWESLAGITVSTSTVAR